MNTTMKVSVGQCLMGGFPGKEMSEDFIKLVKEYKVGNVILFRHNIEDGPQLQGLCQDIQELVLAETGYPAFITIDQEGGAVTRLPEGFCNVAGAMAIAATGKPENAKLAAKITAQELKHLGVNFNLAPVMDVNNNRNNPVIGVRSYGDQPQTVIDYACAAIEGYTEEGVLSCVKHFPGHGDTATDSHVGLPTIDKSLDELLELELLSFQEAIKRGVPAVMSSHILFPQIESEKIPGTMSHKIITGILKDMLGFKGLVMSDCLEMDAIQKYYGTANGAVAAMKAGVDVLGVSHTAKLLEESAKALYVALDSGELSEDRIMEAAEKIIAYKVKYLPFTEIDYDFENNKLLEKQIRKDTLVMTQGSFFDLGKNPYFVGPPDYRVTQVSSKESTIKTFPEYMAHELGGTSTVTSKDPTSEEVQEAIAVAADASSVVIGTYNGHLFPGQLNLAKELMKRHEKVALVALRNPYDLAGLPEHVTAIAAWDYTEMTLELLAKVFASKEMLTGSLPVEI